LSYGVRGYYEDSYGNIAARNPEGEISLKGTYRKYNLGYDAEGNEYIWGW